jgi:hypothetical protein
MASVRQLCDTRAAGPLRLVILGWLCSAAACGGETGQPRPVADAPAALPVAPASGRTVVAEVDGMPVYDDCVAAQMRALGVAGPDGRHAALAQCIDFELLARAAAQRGLAADPEVRRVQKVESVRRLIDEAFARRYPDPSSVDRAQLAAIYEELRLRYVHPEYRDTAYLRYPVALAQHPEGSPADVAARDVMERLYAAVAGRRFKSFGEFQEVAAGVVGDAPLEKSDEPVFDRQSAIAKPFMDAAFAIAEERTVHPPVRTAWGWDIVYLQKIFPEANQSLDDVAGELFEILRRRLFTQWVAGLRGTSRIQLDEDALARLQAAEERARFANVP